jgi:ATP-dependent Clp protease ATP-binding subunit ClpA
MARLIERKVKKPLSEAMLFGALAEGGTARIVVVGDEIRLETAAPDSQPPTPD